MIMVIDVGIDRTYISKVEVVEGTYKPFKNINGNLNDQALKILLMALRHRPEQILIDKMGYGQGLGETIVKVFSKHGVKINSDGTVVY